MRILQVIMFFFLIYICNAQQQLPQTLSIWNKAAINPAATAEDVKWAVRGIYREQWIGLPGAPTQAQIFIEHYNEKYRSAAGLSFNHASISIFNESRVQLSYAYRIPIKKVNLSIGLNGSWTYLAQDLNNPDLQIENPGDPILGENSYVSVFNFGAGLFAQGERFYFGVSAPGLAESILYADEDEAILQGTYEPLYYGTAGFSWPVSEELELHTEALARIGKRYPFQAEISLTGLISEKVYIGTAVRTMNREELLSAVILRTGWKIGDRILLGGGYEIGTTDLNSFHNGTISLLAEYHLPLAPDKSDLINPRFF